MKRNKTDRNMDDLKIYKGISFNKRTGNWSVYVNNKCVGLTFKTEEEAYTAARLFFEKTTGIPLNKINDIKKINDTQSYRKEYLKDYSDLNSKKIISKINYDSYVKKQKEKTN